jgi:hypothetical protein
MLGLAACTTAATPVVANRGGSRCEPGRVSGTISDLDAHDAPAAFTTVAATGGDHDSVVIDRSGDVPISDFVDKVVTDAHGSFVFPELDAKRTGLVVLFYDRTGDRMLEFDGALPASRCTPFRFGVHGRANNADQKPLALVLLAP